MACEICEQVSFQVSELKEIILQLANRFDRQEAYIQKIAIRLDETLSSRSLSPVTRTSPGQSQSEISQTPSASPKIFQKSQKRKQYVPHKSSVQEKVSTPQPLVVFDDREPPRFSFVNGGPSDLISPIFGTDGLPSRSEAEVVQSLPIEPTEKSLASAVSSHRTLASFLESNFIKNESLIKDVNGNKLGCSIPSTSESSIFPNSRLSVSVKSEDDDDQFIVASPSGEFSAEMMLDANLMREEISDDLSDSPGRDGRGHKRTDRGGEKGSFECKSCGARYNWASGLSRHVRMAHRRGSYLRPCGTRVSALGPHYGVRPKNKDFDGTVIDSGL